MGQEVPLLGQGVPLMGRGVPSPRRDSHWDTAAAGRSPGPPSAAAPSSAPAWPQSSPGTSAFWGGGGGDGRHRGQSRLPPIFGGPPPNPGPTAGGLSAGWQWVSSSYSVTPKDHTSDAKENLHSLRHSMANLGGTYGAHLWGTIMGHGYGARLWGTIMGRNYGDVGAMGRGAPQGYCGDAMG